MKIAFVAGFYDPVKKVIDDVHSEHLGNGSLIWIRQGPNGMASLNEFSERFFDRIKVAESILVLLAVPRGREYVAQSVERILQKGKERRENLTCELVTFKNAGDRYEVLQRLKDFGLSDSVAVDVATIRLKVPDGQVLCISGGGKTRILDALKRASFSAEAVETCFCEERIEGARNSNLMEFIESRSDQHTHLIYAWEGLRSMPPKVKRKFHKCYEAQNAAKVVQLFKDYVTEGSS